MSLTEGTRTSAPSWLSEHAVDIVFGAFLLLAFIHACWLTRDYWYWFDDWPLLEQSSSISEWFQPYNGHLSVVFLAIYRALAEVFGLHHTALQVVGILCLLSVPVSYYATTRRFLGPALSALLALSLLAGERLAYAPAELNLLLALTAGIIVAGALNRGPRADGVLAAAAALSLCSAGGGVAVVAGALLHNLCDRAPARRWLAVLVPTAVWVVWWFERGREGTPGAWPGASAAIDDARAIAWEAVRSLGYHNGGVGAVVLIGFLAYGGWTLLRGVRAGANWIAWVGALVVWCLALVYSRGPFADPHAFRYQVVAMGFIALAVVPRRPFRSGIVGGAGAPRGLDRCGGRGHRLGARSSAGAAR